jgi:predicted amidophosphoribosyltransferase
MSLGQQPAQSRLCITKYICPNCPDKVELQSNTCPEKLRELSSSMGLQYRLHKDTTHLHIEPCLQVSELCWKCTLEFDQHKMEQVLRDTVVWRRRLKVFKQRRKGREFGGEE